MQDLCTTLAILATLVCAKIGVLGRGPLPETRLLANTQLALRLGELLSHLLVFSKLVERQCPFDLPKASYRNLPCKLWGSQVVEIEIRDFTKSSVPFRGPQNEDHRVSGSILGSPY